MFGWIKNWFKKPEPVVEHKILTTKEEFLENPEKFIKPEPQLLIDSPVHHPVYLDKQITVNTTDDLLKVLKAKPAPVVESAPSKGVVISVKIPVKSKKPKDKKTVTKTKKKK